jgi:hypothetical protein
MANNHMTSRITHFCNGTVSTVNMISSPSLPRTCLPQIPRTSRIGIHQHLSLRSLAKVAFMSARLETNAQRAWPTVCTPESAARSQ